MQTIDTDLLLSITGGRARASTTLDAKTETALTKLASDVKDLAKPQQNTQLTTLMTVAVMSRLAGR